MKSVSESLAAFSRFLAAGMRLFGSCGFPKHPGHLIVCSLLLSTALPAQAAPLLLWNNDNRDQLVGARGVLVLDQTYDVKFYEGSCRSKWGGCNPSYFTFQTQEQAEAASQALLYQVLIDFPDDPQAQLDTDPAKVRGCEYPLFCLILTPFDLNTTHPVVHYVEFMGALNNLNEYGDNWFIEWDDQVLLQNRNPDYRPGQTIDSEFCSGCTETYAIWSVPEPTSSILFALGILCLTFARRVSSPACAQTSRQFR